MSTELAPIAVITVTYSPGPYLKAFLDSVPGATTLPTHVVMADNGSTDGAPEAAVGPGVELFDTGGNIGYGSAINAVARHLAGRRQAGEINDEYFVVSNPDVVFDPGSLDLLIDAAQRWPRAAAVGPFIREADGSAYPSARAVPTLSNGIGHALLGGIWADNPWSRAYRADSDMSSERPAGWLSGSCLLLRWDAFEQVGGFDERYFMYMEDVDLGDRFGRAGYQNVFSPGAQITHAKGHAAGEHPETMLPAHHESAYRFQADRLTGPLKSPLRVAIWTGLKLRSLIAVANARLRNG
ncbi:glycosyltransferase family 2 protein [Corynebacterium halotolerans]|uniref:glycosyltransferase family 2 protein n=1 Tax=Corynebacterium halotolerans TaxID=225326 RepID=UPI003CF4EB8C